MENRQGFIFYYSFYEALSELPDQNKLELYEAISQYSFNGNEPQNLTGISIPMWKLIRPQLEANNKRYIDGCKGGRPSKKTTGYDEKKTTGYENKKPKEKEKEKVKEKVKDKDKEKVKVKKVITKKEKSFFENNDLNDTFLSFIEMRKQLKKPMTEKSIELALNKLEKMYPGDDEMKKLCINQSIENSWQGLFEVKPEYLKLYGPPGSTKKKAVIVDPNKVLSLNEL